MEENNELEKSIKPEYKSAIEYLSNQTNRLDKLTSQFNMLQTNPLLESGLFNATKKLQSQFNLIKGLNPLLPELANLKANSLALNMLRDTSLSISGLSSNPALKQLGESLLEAKKIAFHSALIKTTLFDSAFFDTLNKVNTSNSMLAVLGTSTLSDIALQSSFSKASALSIFAEKSLSSFPWQDLGQSINLAQSTKRLLSSRFSNLSLDFLNFYKSFEANPISFSELNPILTKSVPVEYYTGANLLETISTEVDNDDADEELVKNEIAYENEYNLKTYLPKVNAGLIKLWQGAIEAYNSNNTDRARHFMTSLRELFTHVMHNLAPDNEITAWTQNPDHFHNGRPTRKTRLSYIYRNIANDNFTKFVDKDIDATLLFIGMFQQGTHEIDNPFNEKQLAAIKSKSESTLKFLLEIHFTTNN